MPLLRLFRGFAAAAFLLATPAVAETAAYQVGFGPLVGGGTASNGAKVRNTSGYALSLERNWQLTDRIALGPRLEVANSFVNTKDSTADGKTTATYDNRIVAAGFRLSTAVGNGGTLAQGVYLVGMVGRGYSKLSVDENAKSSYKQSLYGNIAGNYAAAEVGTWIPLKGSFGLNVAVQSASYRANQREASGTFEEERTAENGLTLTEGSTAPDDGSLEDSVTLRTLAAKVGLSLGF